MLQRREQPQKVRRRRLRPRSRADHKIGELASGRLQLGLVLAVLAVEHEHGRAGLEPEDVEEIVRLIAAERHARALLDGAVQEQAGRAEIGSGHGRGSSMRGGHGERRAASRAATPPEACTTGGHEVARRRPAGAGTGKRSMAARGDARRRETEMGIGVGSGSRRGDPDPVHRRDRGARDGPVRWRRSPGGAIVDVRRRGPCRRAAAGRSAPPAAPGWRFRRPPSPPGTRRGRRDRRNRPPSPVARQGLWRDRLARPGADVVHAVRKGEPLMTTSTGCRARRRHPAGRADASGVRPAAPRAP